MTPTAFVTQAIQNDPNIDPEFKALFGHRIHPGGLRKWPAPVRTEADNFCWMCKERLRDCNCIEDHPR